MKILLHLHLYYADMLPEMLNYLRSLEELDYDLFVTIVGENEALKADILRFKKDAKIITVENRGYDLAPFLKVLQTVNLDEYDYVIKLHTKRDLAKPAYLPCGNFKGGEWRQCLMGFLKNKQSIQSALEILEKNPQAGMISHWKLIIRAGKEDREANRRAEEIMRKMNIKPTQQAFVAGTMFISRANLMKPLQKLEYTADDFDIPAPDHAGGTLAHAMERVLGWLVWAQNSQIVSYEKFGMKDFAQICALKTWRFIYRKHTNVKGITRIKICKIPVFKSKS